MSLYSNIKNNLSEAASNKIPRNWKKISGEMVGNSSGGKAGDKFDIVKDEYGRAIMKYADGKEYQANWSMIRSPEMVKITNVELNESDELKFLSTKDIVKALNIFERFMDSKGYRFYTSVGDSNLGNSSIGVTKDNDKFKCVFDYSVWAYPKGVSVRVEDRNGDFAIGGMNTAAIYSVDNIETIDEETESRILNMLNDAFDKYSVYSEDNRLDKEYNKIPEERKSY